MKNYFRSLGKSSETLLKESNSEIQEERLRLREAEKQLSEAEKINEQKEKAVQEVKDLRIQIERNQARIDQLGSNMENESELRDLQQRAKNYLADLENAKTEVAALEKQAKQKESVVRKEKAKIAQTLASLAAKESERNAMETRLNDTKTLDEMKEQEAELQRQNAEDEAVIENADASLSEKEAARKKEWRKERKSSACANANCGKRKRSSPSRKGESHLQKYSFTVTAIAFWHRALRSWQSSVR